MIENLKENSRIARFARDKINNQLDIFDRFFDFGKKHDRKRCSLKRDT